MMKIWNKCPNHTSIDCYDVWWDDWNYDFLPMIYQLTLSLSNKRFFSLYEKTFLDGNSWTDTKKKLDSKINIIWKITKSTTVDQSTYKTLKINMKRRHAHN